MIKAGAILEQRFHLTNCIGEGGMGLVFQAWDQVLERYVAVKCLLPRLVKDPRSSAEMKQEVRISQELRHPNIVAVYDYRMAGGVPFIVMEYIEGVSLKQYLHTRPARQIEPATFPGFAAQILEAVDYAHRVGVIHRDLKPANIMVSPENQLKLMDFGIAAVRRDQTRRGEFSSALTVQYSSPEQINGAEPAPAMDIYSLGCVFYEMLFGRPPFWRGDVAHQHHTKIPDPLPGTPASLNQAILRCLEKDPRKRWQRAAELQQAILDGKPPPHDASSQTRRAPPPPAPPRPAPPSPAPPPRPAGKLGRLVVLNGTQSGLSIDLAEHLSGGFAEIGRASPSVMTGIRLPDTTRTLSRHQAKLTYSPGTATISIENLVGPGSNPTSVGGRPLGENESVVLHPGDVIGMGVFQLRYEK